ncbi:hypothetical protein HZS_5339 [Henneguya salminicola]|nr:hypothetical protein HZS_5339 [Henneguya salminicola]
MRRGCTTKELFSANSNINVLNRSTQQRPTETNENENMDDISAKAAGLSLDEENPTQHYSS